MKSGLATSTYISAAGVYRILKVPVQSIYLSQVSVTVQLHVCTCTYPLQVCTGHCKGFPLSMPSPSLPNHLQAWLYITVVFTVENVQDSLHNVQENVQNVQDTVQYCPGICAVLIRKQCSTVQESIRYYKGHYV